jgi:hypothetical protein
MPAIRVQFSARHDLSSVAIRAFEHGVWSHVDAVIADGTLLGARETEIGGIPSGVQIRPANYLPFSAMKIVEIDAQESVVDAFYDFLNTQIGKPYDQEAIIAFVLDRDWRGEDSWICSELVAAATEKCGALRYPLSVPCNKVTPDDFYLVCSVLTNLGGS